MESVTAAKGLEPGAQRVLDNLEKDTIGEILNISMGAAATAISTMLDRKVDITTPVVSMVKAESFECRSLEPAIGVEIEYVKGLSGSNIMVMKQRDIRAIVGLLLGDESDIDSVEPLDEMHLSAASEIMNQMMGASSTALASFFGKDINISTPKQFNISLVQEKIVRPAFDDIIVTVCFILNIEGLLKSEFITVMPMEFTKELVMNAMNFEEPEADGFSPPAPAPPPQAPAYSPAAAPRPPERQAASPAQQAQAVPSAPLRQPVCVQPLQFPNFDADADYADEELPGNFGLVMGVPLEVSVEIGKTRMKVKEILDIRQGSLIELDRQAGDPVDIMVNGQLIARGDVVIIDDDFGVRVTEIMSEKGRLSN